MTDNNIYPIFDRMLSREDKEELLGQHSVMIWFTGLSGSGKSTIAIALERELHKRGLLCRILDGDNIRSGINNNLGFTEADRVENIRRIAEVSKLFIDSGIITIAAFISPNNDIREMAANIIGQSDTDKISELIVANTLHNQICLITDRCRETGRGSHTDHYKERHRATPNCEEMESANGKANAAAALLVINSVNKFVMINTAASNT